MQKQHFDTFKAERENPSTMDKMVLSICVGFLTIMMMISCNKGSEKMSTNIYPETTKVDTIDSYFGQEVPDPYHGEEKDFQEVFDILNRSTDGFLEYLKTHHKG